MQEAPVPRDIYFMNDRRRELLRREPTQVLTDERGRKISLLLEEHGRLHLAFVLIEDGDMPARERSGSGTSPLYALQAADHEVASFIEREDAGKAREARAGQLEHMHRTGRVPRNLRVFKAESF